MKKYWKITEYAYALFAIIFLVEAVLNWSEDRERAYLMLGFSILAIAVLLFRRRFRKKSGNRKQG